uniref:hypothetical protein n=1 Tax=Amycolatopsis sp. CA-096443 TaxID=3239919 RepID=UPI003F496327
MSPLNDLMVFDRVIMVHANGNITQPEEFYEPDCMIAADENGQILAEHERDWINGVRDYGWEPLRGYSAQDGYGGPIMHPSEFVGGRLAKEIQSEPGAYVAALIEVIPKDKDDNPEPAGRAVLRYEPKHSDYPHEPGRLPGCFACQYGPCLCDPETDAPCASEYCQQDRADDDDR